MSPMSLRWVGQPGDWQNEVVVRHICGYDLWDTLQLTIALKSGWILFLVHFHYLPNTHTHTQTETCHAMATQCIFDCVPNFCSLMEVVNNTPRTNLSRAVLESTGVSLTSGFQSHARTLSFTGANYQGQSHACLRATSSHRAELWLLFLLWLWTQTQDVVGVRKLVRFFLWCSITLILRNITEEQNSDVPSDAVTSTWQTTVVMASKIGHWTWEKSNSLDCKSVKMTSLEGSAVMDVLDK